MKKLPFIKAYLIREEELKTIKNKFNDNATCAQMISDILKKTRILSNSNRVTIEKLLNRIIERNDPENE